MSMKRMTLLARKHGMSTSDFRAYWAGPHAKLALCMDGITRYLQNRVDKLLWTSGAGGAVFNVDGIVELYFAGDEAMRAAQASNTGKRHIPADEPNFLHGWTLCIVETVGDDPPLPTAKVVVPFLARSQDGRSALVTAVERAASNCAAHAAFNWTQSTAKRAALWSEPQPPDGFVVLWFDSVAAAHDAFDEGGAMRTALESGGLAADAYLVDELVLR